MEELNCSMCHQLVTGGLDGLVQHLKGIHGLTINRGMGDLGFECGQNGCRCRFDKFDPLRRHIRKHHLIDRDDELRKAPEDVFDPLHDELNNDDIKMVDHDAENFNENPVVDCDVDFDFRTFIIGMIARLQCKGSMTGRVLTQVLDECEELLFRTRDFFKANVEQVLQEKEVLNEIGLQDVLQVFELDSPFRGLKTLDQQIEALKQNYGYIEPIEMPLGYRHDDALDHETEECIDGDAFLELTNDDLIQLKIKIRPCKIILKIFKEAKMNQKILLGNYTVDGSGTLLKVDSNIAGTDSTLKEPNVACSSDYQSAQPGSSQSSMTSKPSVDSYSRYNTITEILLDHPQGKTVLKAAQTAFTEENRRALIRILVYELVKVHDSHYPPEQAKIALAMAIVKEFPLLKDEKSPKGYEHYYDSLTKKGFIEYRLWTMRKNLLPTMKKYNASDRKKSVVKGKQALPTAKRLKLLPQEELDEKISWMKCNNPTESNKTAIISCLKETLANRRNWIDEKQPTIAEIFEKYPRLLDYKGEMIDMEFENLFEGATNNFLAKFPSYYSPRILAYSSSHRPELYKMTSNINNEHLRALVILVQLLPVTNAIQKRKEGVSQSDARRKGTKKQKVTAEIEPDNPDKVELSYVAKSAEIPNRSLIQTVREGENLPHFVKNIQRESNTNVQPYMICVHGQRNETFFVQGDGWFIDIHDKSNPTVAFDLLFKCYFVLNLSYPASLQNFYNFMECYIYKIGSQKQSIVSSVHINITNAKLKTSKKNVQDYENSSDDEIVEKI